MRNFTIVFILSLIGIGLQAQSPTRLVRGILTDPETGAPMAGASVVVKGTNTGTVVDANGHYEIEAPLDGILVFSFVGYSTREIPVASLFPRNKNSTDTVATAVKTFQHTVPDDPEKTFAPYFFVMSDNPEVDQMPLKHAGATVSIAGVIADVQVKQVYVNTGKNTLEAVYIFPGSTRAAVYGMSMTIGNRKLMAKIREKDQARKDYEKAKQEGKTATLLEQKRPNIFKMNVANILPGDTITVELKYTELLVPKEGVYEFVYPTVVGPRYSETPDDATHADEKWVKNPYLHQGKESNYTFDFSVRLNTGIPIRKINCTSHKTNINYQGKNRAIVHLDASEQYGGNRDFILNYQLRGGEVESGLLLYPRLDESFFLLMLEPPAAPQLEEIPAREYIFIVDVSGSMQGFPLNVAKELLRKLIGDLRPTDLFNVMLFESSNAMLYQESINATDDNIRDALKLIDKQPGGGGTRLYPALQSALAHPKTEGLSRTFVVVTDGYVAIEKEAFRLVRDKRGEANLFAFGIGSSVNRYLIEGLAYAGMGEPFIVTNEKEAVVVGRKFKELIEKPVLTDIKVTYQGFKAYDMEPVSIPDVFAERPIVIYGKYHGEPTGTITLTGRTGNKSYAKTIDVATATMQNNEALRYLWARNRIKYMDDYAGYFSGDDYREGYGSPERRKEVTELGLKYNLLTKYTSFIAVDSLIRNKSGNSEKVNQPLPLPQGVSDMAVGSVAGISLEPDVQSLSETIVIGYGVVSQQDITCSVTSVKVEEILPGSYVGLDNNLSGRMPGVVVSQTSGAPGESTAVRIRGNNSIITNNSPLYVVDGVPIDNTDHPVGMAGTDTPDRVADISPNDIASVEVLKGPSAIALYGSRGANGVIQITTKAPHRGSKPEINITSSVFADQVNKLPELQNTYAQGRPVSGSTQWQGPDTGEIFSWGPALNTLTYDGSQYEYDKHGRLIPIGSGDGKSAKPYDRTDFFRTGITTQNHVSISQAFEKTKYLASVGNALQRGIVPGTGFNRTTMRVLLGKTFHDKFSISASATMARTVSDLAQRGNSASSVMYGLLTTPASFDNGDGSRATYELEDQTQRSYNGGLTDNPYWSAYKNTYGTTVNRIIPTVSARYEVTPNLSLNYTIGGDVYEEKQRSDFVTGAAAVMKGLAIRRLEDYRSLNSAFNIQGRKMLLDNKIEVNGLVGMTHFYAERELSRTDRNHVLPGTDMAYGTEYDQHNISYSGKLNTKYNNFLVLDLITLQEKTSTLAKGNNHLHTESAGLTFLFTELPNTNLSGQVLSLWKLFTSVSSTQREKPMFLDQNIAQATQLDMSTTVLSPERTYYYYQDKDIRPEQIISFEAGTGLELFSSRVRVNATYYDRNATDLITPVPSAFVPLVNGGKIRNSGIELELSASPLDRDVHWNINALFTKYKSTVKSLADGADRVALTGATSISSSLIAGQPYGVLYGTRYLRNEQGDMVIGSDGFPLVDPEMGVLGNTNPDWLAGINNTLSYKRIFLSFLIDMRHGGVMWNGTRNTMNYYGTSKSTGNQRDITGYIFKGVTEGGQVNTTPVDFAPATGDVTNNRWVRYGRTGVAEDAIEDASWIRMRQLSLSYQFNDDLIRKLGMKKLSVAFVAKNLFLITKYSGIDPETNLTGNSNGRGLDYFNMPNYKSYGVVVKVGL